MFWKTLKFVSSTFPLLNHFQETGILQEFENYNSGKLKKNPVKSLENFGKILKSFGKMWKKDNCFTLVFTSILSTVSLLKHFKKTEILQYSKTGFKANRIKKISGNT